MAQRRYCRACGVDRHAGEAHKDDCSRKAASDRYWEERRDARR